MANKKNTKSDLDILFAEKTIEIAGEEIVIKPITFSALPRASKLLFEIIVVLMQETKQEESEVKDQLIAGMDMGTVGFLVNLLDAGGEKAFELMSVLSGKSLAWIKNLRADDGLLFASELFMVNKDFFQKRLTAILQEVANKVTTVGQK